MTEQSQLLIDWNGPVVTLTLNRPDKLNALCRSLVADLTTALRAVSDTPDIRAIVLTGAGRGFCVGLDLDELTRTEDGLDRFVWNGPDSLFSVAATCPVPIISAVNGPAITGGLELALLGDFLIASDAAVFADTHARVGITPSWGLTQVLPRLIGLHRARRMSLTGEFVDAATARDWGLVTEVTAPDALIPRAKSLAHQIAETDSTTVGRIRGLIGQSANLPLSQGLAQEAEVFRAHIAGVDLARVAVNRDAVKSRGRKITQERASGENQL